MPRAFIPLASAAVKAAIACAPALALFLGSINPALASDGLRAEAAQSTDGEAGGSEASECITYELIASNFTIVGSGTRFRDSGNARIQVALNPQRDFYIFENSSENAIEGCYTARIRGTDFQGYDYKAIRPAEPSVSYSKESADQQCRDLGFSEGTCVPYANIARQITSFNTAFRGAFMGDNILTFMVSPTDKGSWSLFRTFNRGATAGAMIGTDFEWSPEVEQFYASRRAQSKE